MDLVATREVTTTMYLLTKYYILTKNKIPSSNSHYVSFNIEQLVPLLLDETWDIMQR
jgi:hypothetical protein